MGDEAAQLIVQPSGKLCTIRPGLHARRTSRQQDFTTAIDKARHGRRGPPPRRPAVGKTLHDTIRPARTPNQQATRLHQHRQQRQRRLDITDEQESEEHAGNAQERDEPASSRRKTNTQAREMR